MAHETEIHGEPLHTHERSDMSIAAILWFAGGLALTAVILHLVIAWLLAFFDAHKDYGETVSPYAAPRQLPPYPRLQTNAPAELRDYRAKEDQVLNTYGWENKASGIARIPIDRAIDLIAQRGLPATPSAIPMKNPAMGTKGQVIPSTGTSLAPGNPNSLPVANPGRTK